MLLVNIDYIPGQEIDVLGLVQGSVVQAKNVISDHVAGWQSFFGGEVTEYSDMLEESRKIAVEKMKAQAQALCADAIINIRFGSSAVMGGAAEIIAYGTAVKFK